MTISDLDFYKKKLEQELLRLETELDSVAQRNPENPEEWRVVNPDLRPQVSDAGDMADQFEEFETQTSIEAALSARLKSVRHALKSIEKGAYGTCEVDGKPIEKKRLDANPAATTCVKHAPA